jgi:hypothetical protein
MLHWTSGETPDSAHTLKFACLMAQILLTEMEMLEPKGVMYVSRGSLMHFGATEDCPALREGLNWLRKNVKHNHFYDGLSGTLHDWEIDSTPCSDPNDSTSTDVWRLSDVVAALFKERPKFAGIDGYQWLIEHDGRAKMYAVPEPSVKVEVFDPKELKEGDVFENLCGSAAVLCVDRHCIAYVWNGTRHICGVLEVLRISRVLRPDSTGKLVQIFPKPVPKFKVGDKVKATGIPPGSFKDHSCVGNVINVIASHPLYYRVKTVNTGMRWNWLESQLELAPEPPLEVGTWRQWTRGHQAIGCRFRLCRVNGNRWWYEQGGSTCGQLDDDYINSHSIPCAQFKSGDTVEYRKTRVLVQGVYPEASPSTSVSLYSMDGEQFLAWAKPDDLTLVEPAKEGGK